MGWESKRRSADPPRLTNVYAAVPSLHFGWNLLVGIALVRAGRHRAVRTAGVLSPIAMALAGLALALRHARPPGRTAPAAAG